MFWFKFISSASTNVVLYVVCQTTLEVLYVSFCQGCIHREVTFVHLVSRVLAMICGSSVRDRKPMSINPVVLLSYQTRFRCFLDPLPTLCFLNGCEMKYRNFSDLCLFFLDY